MDVKLKGLEACQLCPRHCGVNRYQHKGFCQASAAVKVALVSLHQWEEPCLSGINGAGTIFFAHCNMQCIYCQNYKISIEGEGLNISIERLAEIFLEQQGRGAHCIDLVTPTHYAAQIKEALLIAKAKGLHLPVVYNCSGYENPATIASLEGLIDIYLPDFKYFNNDTAREYSKVKNYVEQTKLAIATMFKQVGPPQFNEEGIMTKGVLVRHMILPWHYKESLALMEYLYHTYGDNIYISIMNQFVPQYLALTHPKLKRKLTTFEYEKVVNKAVELGIKNCFIQGKTAATEDYIPHFDGRNVLRDKSPK